MEGGILPCAYSVIHDTLSKNLGKVNQFLHKQAIASVHLSALCVSMVSAVFR